MWGGSLSAQGATNAPTPRSASVSPPPALVFPPPSKAPVELFRELLAMNLSERHQALSNRPPEVRKQILAKLREYETLKPDERELRLKVTELRWYLYPLMRTPLSNRVDLLSRVPAADRQLVEDRLREWDKLSPEAQKELLKYDAAIAHLPDLQRGTNQPSPSRAVEMKVKQWQALPEEQRQKLKARAELYFNLTEAEQKRVLSTLSEPERQQIARTLDKFKQLDPGQRARCMQSFDKFASLSPTERQEFLKNAERWALMKPAEREQWRQLVNTAQILPPQGQSPRLRFGAVGPPGIPVATNNGH
jgi:hypothetical protein